jgi:hypothetical protein
VRARIPAKYSFDAWKVAETISDVLRAASLNPGVSVDSTGLIVTNEPTISGPVKLQIKNAVLPLLTDTTLDTDITA